MNACWPLYRNARELIQNAEVVYIGKVTDVSFEVLNMSTLEPVDETTPDYLRRLMTIYEVEVITPYKGITETTTKFRVSGGMIDYRVEEQLELIQNKKAFLWEYNHIPVYIGFEDFQCEIGKTSLFVLRQFEVGAPTILNPHQSVFSLENPKRKQTIRDYGKEYFKGSKDDYGYPMISPKDVISEFGKDKWIKFWKQWKAENDV